MTLEKLGGGGVIVEAEGPLGTPKGWSTVASLSTARSRHAAAEANGLVYAIGGEDGSAVVSSVEEYDPSTDTWSTVASLSTARQYLTAAEANGLVYAIGGDDAGGTVFSSVEELGFQSFANVYTATGDTLIGIDDPNGTLLNRATGREQTGDSLIAQSGETIAAFTDSQARIYRTEET